MSERIHVMLLYGGNSGEHEISCLSAASILKNLNPERYCVTLIGIDKQGNFYRNHDVAHLSSFDSLPVKTDASECLPNLFQNGQPVVQTDVIFPALHGPLYEDGALQGLFEQVLIPYVGSGVLASAIGMQKDMTRRVVCDDFIQSVDYRMLSYTMSFDSHRAILEAFIKQCGFPLFVKPCSLGSSVGVSRVLNRDELFQSVADAFHYDTEILVEKALVAREIELAVLESDNPSTPPLVSLPGEISVNHPDGFYSYRAKYLDDQAVMYHIPANLSDNTIHTLQKMSQIIFMRLGCRGMARVDFFVDVSADKIYFNEINTLPGFTKISMYPKLMAESGISYPQLLDKLIMLAIRYNDIKRKRVTSYQ